MTFELLPEITRFRKEGKILRARTVSREEVKSIILKYAREPYFNIDGLRERDYVMKFFGVDLFFRKHRAMADIRCVRQVAEI